MRTLWPNFWLLLSIFLEICATWCTSLNCFDSNTRDTPTTFTTCGSNQLCYAEFYSLAEAAESARVTEWHVDRFCVHEKQCKMRGIGADCVSIQQLDKVVQRTFRKKLDMHADQGWRRLLHSHFCCCDSDLCNRLDLAELHQRFNLSTDLSVYAAAANPRAPPRTTLFMISLGLAFWNKFVR